MATMTARMGQPPVSLSSSFVARPGAVSFVAPLRRNTASRIVTVMGAKRGTLQVLGIIVSRAVLF